MSVIIGYLSTDGEERDEPWPSVDAFRNWAIGAGWHGVYRVYEADEDGDLIPILSGHLSPA
ncbi:MAG: hypothetical protein ACOCXA_06215 [Planctomycetota bacterium]